MPVYSIIRAQFKSISVITAPCENLSLRLTKVIHKINIGNFFKLESSENLFIEGFFSLDARMLLYMDVVENGSERKMSEIILDEVWSKRGTISKSSEGIALPPEWKSGYGLPLVMALKEADKDVARDGNDDRKRVFCLGLFEDRTLGKKISNFVPIGYIFLEEVLKDQLQMVSSDNMMMGVTSRTINLDGSEERDPLFSKLNDTAYATIGTRKVPLAAIRVGFDATYGEQRDRTIAKLKKTSRTNDTNTLEEMRKNARGLESGGDMSKLVEYQHTHLGLGQLLLSGAIDICRRAHHQKLHFNATNEFSRKLVEESPFSYTEETSHGSRNLIVSVEKRPF